MSNVLIMAPAPLSAVVGDGVNPGNLMTPDPREVWTSTASATVSLTVTLPAPAAIDTLFLGYAHLSAPSAVRVSVGGSQIAAGVFALPRFAAGRPAHAVVQFAAPVAAASFVVAIDLAAADRPLSLGVLMLGDAFQPAWNHEWGSGRTIVDLGTRSQLQGGGFGIDPGAIKPGWQWSLGDLGDDEVERLYSIVLDRGETGAVLVVEDPAATAGLCERIHYGTFDKLEAYERRDTNLTRWGLRIEDWL